jgi:hypothetical protein
MARDTLDVPPPRKRTAVRIGRPCSGVSLRFAVPEGADGQRATASDRHTTKEAHMSATAFQTDRGTRETRDHSEGPVTRMIEEQTAKLPSDVYLGAALASMAVSLMLQLMDKKEESLFVGQWAPSFLILGVYNKLVKVAGSDRVHS